MGSGTSPQLERARAIVTRFAEEKSLEPEICEAWDWYFWKLDWQTGNNFDCGLMVHTYPGRIRIVVDCHAPSYSETNDHRKIEIALFHDDLEDFTPVWAALEAGLRWGESCVEELDATGRPAFEPLLVRLHGDDWVDRSIAAGVLGRLGDLRAVPSLLQALEDERPSVQGEAANSLSRLGIIEALPAIESMQNRSDREPSTYVQGAIDDLRVLKAARDAEPASPPAERAGRKPGSPAILLLPAPQKNQSHRREPRSPDPSVHLKRLAPVLTSFAHDFRLRLDLIQDSWGCHWRLRWVTSMGNERAIGVGHDSSDWIHVWVERGLPCHPQAFDEQTTHIGAYPKLVTDFGPFWAALEAGVRRGETSMCVVNEDGRPGIEEYIARLRNSDAIERRTAAGILGSLGDRNAAPALLGALDDVDRIVRLKAAESLGLLGEPATLSELQRRLPGADPEDEAIFVEAIERIQRKRAFINDPPAP